MHLSEVFETKNSYYMVMDMLSGGNLLDLIQNKTLNNFNVVGILKGLIQAVEYIHGLSIMHRDIKPENIMFRSGSLETDDVYLVDFGLSTYTDQEEVIFLKCGTPGYVAPEIFEQNKEGPLSYSKSCDIFSVGVVLHVIVFGYGPFKGKNYSEVYNANRTCLIPFENPIY